MWVGADPAALQSLGMAAQERGDHETAVALLERALDLAPAALTSAALGISYQVMRRSTEALAALRRAVFLEPALAGAQNALGIEYLARACPADACRAFAAAVSASPGLVAARVNLGLALQRLGRLEAAEDAFRRSIELQPGLPDAHNALGTVLQQQGRVEEAAEAYHRALAADAAFTPALNNLGRSVRELGRVDDAIELYGRAIAQKPDYADAHWNRALLKLLSGRFQEGWEEHEWRWRVATFPSARRSFAAPLWNGEKLAGATIFLHAEQGFGDTIQFLRYVPLVAKAGGRVVLQVQPALQRLAATVPGVERLLAPGEPVPPTDWHAPLLSLPRACRTTLATIPAGERYLAPQADDVRRWQDRLPARGKRRVGLVWAGSPTHTNNRNRSISSAMLAPALEVRGTEFFSLQVGATEPLPPGMTDLSGELRDFAETAAALSSLDLLISVDTSTAHLAGALGVPVWVLIPFAPDWRWLLGRDDSPWYPSMRLFRQRTRGDWADVISRVARAITELPPLGKR